MIKLEEWTEVRRLHRAEGVPIKEIARRLGLARNTVRSALRADGPPRDVRPPRGSLVDAVEPQVRALLAQWPRMPATVIAQRIGWQLMAQKSPPTAGLLWGLDTGLAVTTSGYATGLLS